MTPDIRNLKECMEHGHEPAQGLVFFDSMLKRLDIPYAMPRQVVGGRETQPIICACGRCGLVYFVVPTTKRAAR